MMLLKLVNFWILVSFTSQIQATGNNGIELVISNITVTNPNGPNKVLAVKFDNVGTMCFPLGNGDEKVTILDPKDLQACDKVMCTSMTNIEPYWFPNGIKSVMRWCYSVFLKKHAGSQFSRDSRTGLKPGITFSQVKGYVFVDAEREDEFNITISDPNKEVNRLLIMKREYASYDSGFRMLDVDEDAFVYSVSPKLVSKYAKNVAPGPLTVCLGKEANILQARKIKPHLPECQVTCEIKLENLPDIAYQRYDRFEEVMQIQGWECAKKYLKQIAKEDGQEEVNFSSVSRTEL